MIVNEIRCSLAGEVVEHGDVIPLVEADGLGE
jgi:hypothetical protein